jgi:hypothetical protein
MTTRLTVRPVRHIGTVYATEPRLPLWQRIASFVALSAVAWAAVIGAAYVIARNWGLWA